MVMTVEDRQTVVSVLVAATLSFVVVGVALVSTVAFTDRTRPALETGLISGLQPPPSHLAWNGSR